MRVVFLLPPLFLLLSLIINKVISLTICFTVRRGNDHSSMHVFLHWVSVRHALKFSRIMSTDTAFDYGLFLSNNNTSYIDKLSIAAFNIAYHNFQWRHVTLLLFNSTILSGLDLFLERYDKSLIINCAGVECPSPGETQQFVIFETDVKIINLIVRWTHRRGFDNTGKFIVVCEYPTTKSCNESEAIATFWQYKITNVVFLKLSVGNEIEAYTYTHHYDEKCTNSPPLKVKNLNQCIDDKENCKMFRNKTHNLNKCPLVVSSFIQPPFMMINDGNPTGSDGDLLRIIAEGLNATLQLMEPRRGQGWGELNREGKWVGCLGDVYDDVANFSMTSPVITLNRAKAFQMSVDYNVVAIAWAAPPTQIQPASLKLLHPFKIYIHIAVIFSFILIIIIGLITKSRLWINVSQTTNIDSSRRSIVFYAWMICMGLPTQNLPKKPVLLYAVVMWIWYCFLVRSFYQAALIGSLKNTVLSSNFQTLEEILKTDYQIGGARSLKEYYKDYPEVQDRWVGLDTGKTETILYDIQNGLKFAIAGNVEHILTFNKMHEIRLHILPLNVLTSPTVLYFKKFSPIVNSVNVLLRRLVETGFSDKFYKKYFRPTKHISDRATDKKTPITIIHYTGCYAIIFAGWLVSSLIFVCELMLGCKDCKVAPTRRMK